MYNARTPEMAVTPSRGSVCLFPMPRPSKATNLTGRGDPRKPRLTGEGDFVSIHNPSKPSEERKRRKSVFTEISSAAVAPPQCFDTPTPDEKARRNGEGQP
jgi:hypothetical protein